MIFQHGQFVCPHGQFAQYSTHKSAYIVVEKTTKQKGRVQIMAEEEIYGSGLEQK